MSIHQDLKIKTIFKEKIFTVSEFLDFLNEILIPQKVIVQGEIGKKVDNRPNYSIFNLIDKKDHSVLKCFIWKSKLNGLGLELKEGREVKVLGYPKIYKSPYGSEFEFEVEQIWLVGEGVLKQAFEALKKKLEKEGLFDPQFKKPLPLFCQNIGLITSKYGKGAKPDFEKHLGKFGFQVYFYDVRVEGIFAVEEIIGAIRWFNENMKVLDVLVLIRGGGNWESLQVFNSEPVARAIFGSKIPIICGVGHESDYTIADLVADVRASTPTDAAKILNESWQGASIKIGEFEKSLSLVINKLLKSIKERIDSFSKILTKEVKILIKNQENEAGEVLKNLIKNQKRWGKRIKELIDQQEEKLILSSPQLKLKQGYTLTLDEFGKIIKEPSKLKITQIINTKFYKGQVFSKIQRIKR